MNAGFSEYLASIGMGQPLIERVSSIHGFFVEVCPDEIVSVFVTDLIKQDGERVYDSLWFFSKKYAMEAKAFVGNDSFDIAPIHNCVRYALVAKSDYDFKQASEKSRMQLHFNLYPENVCLLQAAKQNCDSLKEIFMRHVRPNLIG